MAPCVVVLVGEGRGELGRTSRVRGIHKHSASLVSFCSRTIHTRSTGVAAVVSTAYFLDLPATAKVRTARACCVTYRMHQRLMR